MNRDLQTLTVGYPVLKHCLLAIASRLVACDTLFGVLCCLEKIISICIFAISRLKTGLFLGEAEIGVFLEGVWWIYRTVINKTIE